MLSRNIKFENFKTKSIGKKLKTLFKNLVRNKDNKENLINSFTSSYSYSYNKQQLKKYKKYNIYQIFGMGGSSLGAQAIYDFLKINIKKSSIFLIILMNKIN